MDIALLAKLQWQQPWDVCKPRDRKWKQLKGEARGTNTGQQDRPRFPYVSRRDVKENSEVAWLYVCKELLPGMEESTDVSV